MASRAGERRRRRTPEEAEREILDAAEAFLRSRPFRDLTIDEVMASTGLSRPSFYVYFRDRHHIALKLIEGIGGEMFESAESWLLGEGEGPAALRPGLAGIAAVYGEHGRMLRAIADAATEDEAVEQAYRGLVEGFVDATAAQIEREVQRGHTQVDDPERTASALVWMTERFFVERLGREPADDPERVAGTLFMIWSRVLYR